MKKNEDEFRKEIMKLFESCNIWCKRIEPARGMLPGIPDVVALLSNYPWFIELKVGEYNNGIIYPREVRPAQINWHREYSEAGGRSLVLVGFHNGRIWQVFGLWPEDCTDWKEGISPDKCFFNAELNYNFINDLKHAINSQK